MDKCPFCGKGHKDPPCRHWVTLKDVKCSQCKAAMTLDGSWRFSDGVWEHKCPGLHPQSGYFKQESKDDRESGGKSND